MNPIGMSGTLAHKQMHGEKNGRWKNQASSPVRCLFDLAGPISFLLHLSHDFMKKNPMSKEKACRHILYPGNRQMDVIF